MRTYVHRGRPDIETDGAETVCMFAQFDRKSLLYMHFSDLSVAGMRTPDSPDLEVEKTLKNLRFFGPSSQEE